MGRQTESGPIMTPPLGSKDEIARLLSEFDRNPTALPVWAMRLVNGLRYELKLAWAELAEYKGDPDGCQICGEVLPLREVSDCDPSVGYHGKLNVCQPCIDKHAHNQPCGSCGS